MDWIYLIVGLVVVVGVIFGLGFFLLVQPKVSNMIEKEISKEEIYKEQIIEPALNTKPHLNQISDIYPTNLRFVRDKTSTNYKYTKLYKNKLITLEYDRFWRVFTDDAVYNFSEETKLTRKLLNRAVAEVTK